LVDDKIRDATEVKSLNPELGDDAQGIDECLVFYHIVGRIEV
jgi:hypothetical protein